MAVETSASAPRTWLLTAPRTASNLLMRILNLDEQNVQPAINGGYFFHPAFVVKLKLMNKPMENWSNEEFASVAGAQRECFKRLQTHIEDAEVADKIIFVKEHVVFMNDPVYEAQYWQNGEASIETGAPKPLPCSSIQNPTRSSLNLTCMPDEFLKTWHPTVLIRHPAMMLPSLLRTFDGSKERKEAAWSGRRVPHDIEMTTKWFRTMFDFYVEQFGEGSQWPIVIDADDIMTSRKVVEKYALLTSLDPNKLRFTWEKASEEEISKLPAGAIRMTRTLNGSSGVDMSKVAGKISIDEETVKWRAEFGQELGSKLERWVRNAMPDYEYMYTQRLKSD
ncbi:hypothetical protein F5Y18DRAFT_416981 [Xylariaceae sp. FL1019]|nr:hypothetical protein F5Y18DRAFT_416981 [Xylariaceae sp. FL1019]